MNEASHNKWKALAVLGIAYLMVVLDVAIVNVALSQIQADLQFDPSDLQWVVSGYALTFGGFLLLGGRMGDILGRRRLFVTGQRQFPDQERWARRVEPGQERHRHVVDWHAGRGAPLG